MPEQKTNYMTALDEWSQREVLNPLNALWVQFELEMSEEEQEEAEAIINDVKKKIREKVLESYHNGQNLSQKRFQRPIQARK